MTDSSDEVKGILERILTSYGVRSRPELAELLKIPLPTIQNWVSRGSLPGDYVVQCALDTGADLRFLMTGQLANVSFSGEIHPSLKGKKLFETMLANGGKTVLQRVLHAYGFSMQKQLGDLLDIPSGTMSAWIRRDYFPGDVVITCALDTGVSLAWLATGIGEYKKSDFAQTQSNPQFVSKAKLTAGTIEELPPINLDVSMFGLSLKQPLFLVKGAVSWLIEKESTTIGNGDWLLDIDGNKDVYSVSRLPGNRIKVTNDTGVFECSVNDVKPIGIVALTINKSL